MDRLDQGPSTVWFQVATQGSIIVSFHFALLLASAFHTQHYLRVKDLITKFTSFYTPSSPSWITVSDAVSGLGWTDLVAQTSANYYDSQGISPKFSREIIEAATRVNYGQVCSSTALYIGAWLMHNYHRTSI